MRVKLGSDIDPDVTPQYDTYTTDAANASLNEQYLLNVHLTAGRHQLVIIQLFQQTNHFPHFKFSSTKACLALFPKNNLQLNS